MRFSVRKFLATSVMVVALAVASFGGRPFLEAQQPDALPTGSLADILAATADAAAVDYFLKIDGIDGEATAKGYEGQIEIESFSWGATNAGSQATGSGGGAGKVSFQDIHFTTRTSKASPKLFLACASGQHIKEAVLVARKSGEDQQEFLKIKMTDLLVSSYQTGGSSGEVVPTDQFSLNFSKIEFQYTPQRADGRPGAPVTATYDLKTNKGA